jgi:hypothetical protein
MVSTAAIRSKLDNKIFDKFGVSATHTPYSSQTLDKWGDGTVTYATAATITIVPYGRITARYVPQPFGDLSENEMAIVVKYSTTIGIDDKITYDSTTYRVSEIEKYDYGGVVAQSIRLDKIL